MHNKSSSIQATAKQLLADKKVDLVIGFAPGSIPLRSTPYFARSEAEADNLIWDQYCENNLANYLRQREERVAVVAKGCDVRTIVSLIKENQIDRDKLYIIGVPCTGMIDHKKAQKQLGAEVVKAEVAGDEVSLQGADATKQVALDDLLYDSCQRCSYGTPTLYDELVGEEIPVKDLDFSEIEAFEAKSAEDRASLLAAEMEKCIRCYACRNACPMCFCTECFADSTSPQWINNRADSTKDNLLFQSVRIFHLMGRCADCGACERACPVGIKLSLLTRKGVKDVKTMFDYDAGLKVEDKPVLNDFTTEDPQPFLMKE